MRTIMMKFIQFWENDFHSWQGWDWGNILPMARQQLKKNKELAQPRNGTVMLFTKSLI